MIRMINTAFGNEMWVAEERVKEYLAAGHKLAAGKNAEKPAKMAKAVPRTRTAKK